MSWSVLQSAGSAASASTGSKSLAFSTANLSSGSKIIVAVSVSMLAHATATVASVDDGNSNNLTLIGRKTSGTNTDVSLWAMDTPAGDVGTKPTMTVTLSGSNGEISMVIMEVSGLLSGNTTAMCDGTLASNSGSGGSSTGTPTYSSTAANEFLVSVYGDDGGPETWTKPTSTTSATGSVNSNGNADCAVAYKNSANGTESDSWALSGSAADWCTLIVAFKLASSGTTYDADVTETVTASVTAGAALAPAVAGASQTITASRTAGAVLSPAVAGVTKTVTATITADATVTSPTSADVSKTITATATAGALLKPAVAGASLSVSADITASATVTSLFNFPITKLGLMAEVNLNGTWTDVTDYAVHNTQDSAQHPAAIVIQRGRPDELTNSANPATASFQVNNVDGRFTSRNPTGPYYPYLTRNTQTRWSILADSVYLRIETDNASYAHCPDSSGVSVTGDLELQVEFELDNYGRGYLADKWSSGSSQSWVIQLNLDGTVSFFWSVSGTDSKEAQSTYPIPIGHQALKVTMDVDNGASGNTVTFYTADSLAGSWTQLGDAVTDSSGTTSIFDSTAVVKVGNGCMGKFYGFKLLSGIGGTVKASPDFTSATAGASSLTDAQSNSWTLTGTAEYSNRDYRFHGEMASLPTTWDITGNDVWTPVGAAGILRRMQQGQSPPIQSAMKRAILAKTGDLAPVAYWPCEDGQNATTIASGISGGQAATYQNATPQLASNSDFDCSSPILVLNGASINCPVPDYTSNGDIVVRFLLSIPSGTSAPDKSNVCRVFITGGHIAYLTLRWGTAGTLSLVGWSADGGAVIDTGYVAFGLTGGQKVWVSIELRQVGSDLTGSVTTLVPGASTGSSTSDFVVATGVGNVSAVIMAPYGTVPDFAVGQISVQSKWESLFDDYNPLNAWKGETAGNRFYRLCSENSITGCVIGHPDLSVAMGSQLPDTFLNLTQQCEDADRGQIYEPRYLVGLAYRTLASMTNQTAEVTFDYSKDHLSPPLAPTDDDQFTVNDVTASNVDGSSARAVLDDGSAMSISPPPVGVGEYATSVSVNLDSDDLLDDIANWVMHVGTTNEERYPSVVVDLASTSTDISDIVSAVKGCDIGDFVEIDNPPAFMPPGPIKLLAWGLQESLGDFCYEIQYNCVPESPYEVANISTGLGKVDTAGSSLHADITDSATSISVDTTDTYLWTTDSDDCPMDIMVGGEQMTVTAISGSSSPQTFTVTRSVNGVTKAQTAGTAVSLYRPSIVALTG